MREIFGFGQMFFSKKERIGSLVGYRYVGYKHMRYKHIGYRHMRYMKETNAKLKSQIEKTEKVKSLMDFVGVFHDVLKDKIMALDNARICLFDR